MGQDTYEVKVKCDNCNKKSKIKIIKGKGFDSLISFWHSPYLMIKCIHCGCKYLTEDEDCDKYY